MRWWHNKSAMPLLQGKKGGSLFGLKSACQCLKFPFPSYPFSGEAVHWLGMQFLLTKTQFTNSWDHSPHLSFSDSATKGSINSQANFKNGPKPQVCFTKVQSLHSLKNLHTKCFIKSIQAIAGSLHCQLQLANIEEIQNKQTNWSTLKSFCQACATSKISHKLLLSFGSSLQKET